MIRVDINILTINRRFEFQLDENVPIGSLTDEICSIISTKINRKWEKSPDQINLCDKDLQTLLPKTKTLKECGVKNGHELMLC